MIPLPHKIRVYKTGERDEWGIISPSTTFVEYPAFVQSSSKITVNQDGREVKTDLNITLEDDRDIQYSDFIEFKEIKKQPLSIERIFDLSGTVKYVKVLL